ncbi:MAG: hypothetical protein IAB16_05285 [Firmicutes bacterium]|uniref:Uncharacterized protein n=1 Tax=Candidatus Stercoripulliclostridium pullicola TaxID=2840953 RepID=A0A940DGS1_9FIRM|nr:hypothetical protein [Candidatus Stercoripulliclostridium pullicola]
MNRTVHERTFLEAFFAADSIVGRIADRRAVFDEIGKICCISNKRLGELCKYIDLPELEEIKDPSSYEQLMRVLDYSEKFGTGAGYGADILDLLECKGEALLKLADTRGRRDGVSDRESAVSFVSAALRKNYVFPLAIAAFLLLSGTVVKKDVVKGLEAAHKCARWNNVFGMLLLMRYDNSNAPKYLGMLDAVLSFGALNEEYAPVFAEYGKPSEEFTSNVKLTETYLNRNPREAESYNPAMARIIYSPLLSLSDKYKAVLANSSEHIAALNSLPLTARTSVGIGAPIETYFTEKRRGEARAAEAVLRAQISGKGKPLMLVGKDEYVAESYVGALSKAFADVRVISAKDITKRELLPTQEHFAIAGLMAMKRSAGVFVIKDLERLNQECVAEMSKLFDRSSLKAFYLSDMRVTLDLSGSVFIAISGEKVSDTSLSKLFRQVETAPLYDEEKRAIADDYAANCARVYGVSAEFAEAARRTLVTLCDFGTGHLKEVVEKVCIARAASSDTSPVGAAEVEAVARKCNDATIGFKIKI